MTTEVPADDKRWADLAKAFPPDQVEKLPKVMRREDQDKGKCEKGSKYSADGYYCGRYHARALHLDYIGHAGVTMRLNEVDPHWNWEPLAFDADGQPFKVAEGMWIKLTVLGVTRIGFGDSGTKRGPDAIKELIGDAIRNAAMRFGVGTYLWSKSDYAANMQGAEGVEAVEHQRSTGSRDDRLAPQNRKPPAAQLPLLKQAQARVWQGSRHVDPNLDDQQRMSWIAGEIATRNLDRTSVDDLNKLADELDAMDPWRSGVSA